MKEPNPRHSFHGLAGAVAVLALLALFTTAVAAATPAVTPSVSRDPTQSAGASQPDQSASPSTEAGESASPSASASESPGASPSASPSLANQCRGFNDKSEDVIEGLVNARTAPDTDPSHKGPHSSMAPVVPPGLQQVYNRMEACEQALGPTDDDSGANPTATPAGLSNVPSGIVPGGGTLNRPGFVPSH
jgi:hypothetical protein